MTGKNLKENILNQNKSVSSANMNLNKQRESTLEKSSAGKVENAEPRANKCQTIEEKIERVKRMLQQNEIELSDLSKLKRTQETYKEHRRLTNRKLRFLSRLKKLEKEESSKSGTKYN